MSGYICHPPPTSPPYSQCTQDLVEYKQKHCLPSLPRPNLRTLNSDSASQQMQRQLISWRRRKGIMKQNIYTFKSFIWDFFIHKYIQQTPFFCKLRFIDIRRCIKFPLTNIHSRPVSDFTRVNNSGARWQLRDEQYLCVAVSDFPIAVHRNQRKSLDTELTAPAPTLAWVPGCTASCGHVVIATHNSTLSWDQISFENVF